MADRQDRVRFLAFILLLLLLWYAGSFFSLDVNKVGLFFKKLPILISAALFIASYVVVTFFIWFSKDVFRLVAAVLFGPYVSTLFVFLAETINACVLFGFSRFFGRDFVERRFGGAYKDFEKKFAGNSVPWLLLLRLAPLVPFRFMDLAMGLSGISLRKYLLIVILGSPLRIFWVQYVLAGVGISFLKSPDILMQYLLRHQGIFAASAVYLALVFIAWIKLARG